MNFKDRLRDARKKAGMTQEQLAKAAHVTTRSIQNYEMGARRPRDYDTIRRLAGALEMTSEELLDSTGNYVVDAGQRGGAKAAREIEELVGEVTGLFAGGELSEDAMDGAIKAIYDAYWLAKEKNKKYTPKKYRDH